MSKESKDDLMLAEVRILNHVILVGRLTGTPEIIESENHVKRTVVTLAVPRTFKNAEGVYDTDFLKCVLWNGIAQRASEYCKKGDVVCMRGRLQVSKFMDVNGLQKYYTEVVVESIAFVTSVKENDLEKQD